MSIIGDRAVNALQTPNGDALSSRRHNEILGRGHQPESLAKIGVDHAWIPSQNEVLLHSMTLNDLR